MIGCYSESHACLSRSVNLRFSLHRIQKETINLPWNRYYYFVLVIQVTDMPSVRNILGKIREIHWFKGILFDKIRGRSISRDY